MLFLIGMRCYVSLDNALARTIRRGEDKK